MQLDSLISSIIYSAFLIMAVVMVLVIGVIVVVFRMIARNNNAAGAGGAAGRMSQPVSGTLLVTGITTPISNSSYHSASLTGVVSAEGVPATAVTQGGLIRTSKWPRPGQTLPIIVDRANPANFAIEWDKVEDNEASALGEAEAIAAAMRRGEGSMSAPNTPGSDYPS